MKFVLILFTIFVLTMGSAHGQIIHLWNHTFVHNPPSPVSLNGTEGFGCLTNDREQSIAMLTRNGLTSNRFRWRNFNVFIDNSYNDWHRDAIARAMTTLQGILPCVRFLVYQRSDRPSGDYIHVRRHGGCWSDVGRRGGAQAMSLSWRCLADQGIIIHEMIHALGLFHEHSREDRDAHVRVNMDNVNPRNAHNFDIAHGTSTFGVPYNVRSIMHYLGRAFTRNGLPTIESLNGEQVGSVGVLQDTDIQKLRRMYNC